MTKILIDTSFIISLLRKNDENHNIAKLNKSILKENDCYITNYVLNEVITIISMRTKDINITKIAYCFMLDNFKIINEFEIPEFNSQTMTIFEKYNQTTFHLSFIDCSLILLIMKYKINYLLTFDKYFKKVDEIEICDILTL